MHTNIIDKTTIYAGADSNYWQLYGTSFVKSFQHHNPEKIIHIHLFNPSDIDLGDLEKLSCNYSYEYINDSEIKELTESSKRFFEDPSLDSKHYDNLKYCSKYYDILDFDKKLREMMKFTIFACRRFINLSKMWDGKNPVIAYDIDSICRNNLNLKEIFSGNDQGCLSVKGNRFVVSMVAFKNDSNLLKDWTDSLEKSFLDQKVYNFLDQDTFVKFSENFEVTKIGKNFCDHTSKNKNSLVITGKGSAKYSSIFIEEQNKWK